MLAIVDFLRSLMPISTSAHASDDLICTYMRHLILHDAYLHYYFKLDVRLYFRRPVVVVASRRVPPGILAPPEGLASPRSGDPSFN